MLCVHGKPFALECAECQADDRRSQCSDTVVARFRCCRSRDHEGNHAIGAVVDLEESRAEIARLRVERDRAIEIRDSARAVSDARMRENMELRKRIRELESDLAAEAITIVEVPPETETD